MKRFDEVLILKTSIAIGIIPSLVLASDIRPREGQNISVRHISEKIDIVNIAKPTNGTSHNTFLSFDVNGNVVLNNSTQAGNSQLAGKVEANTNLKGESANLIIAEIQSSKGSSINGAIEVFGQKADLLLANENGFALGDAVFLNTQGVSFVGGRVNGREVDIKSTGNIVLNGNVFVDGSYFNVIAQSIRFSGGVSSYSGERLDRINFITGNNIVSLNEMSNPSVRVKRENKTQSGIDGSLMGSMNAGVVKFVATGKGLGVKHSGMILSPKDIIIESDSGVELNTLKSEGSVKITSKDASSIFLDAKNITINTQGHTLNRGVMNAKNLEIIAGSFENKSDEKSLSELLKLKITDTKPMLNADTLTLSASTLKNQGNLYAGALTLNSREIDNQGEILAEAITINLSSNHLKNQNGQIAAKNELRINAQEDFSIDSGGFYGGKLLAIDALGALNINTALLSPSSITIRAKSITNNNLLASAGSLTLIAREDIINKGYLYGEGSLSIEQAKLVDNQSGMHSNGLLQIESNEVRNSGIIFAENININAKEVHNLAKLNGEVSLKLSDKLSGVGSVNYGDTAWKRWVSNLTLSAIPTYENGLYLQTASIQATKNIAINTKNEGKNLHLRNEGWILAHGDIKLGGVVENITKTQEIGIEDILRQIKTEGIFNKEFLGKWNTNHISYLSKGEHSLLDILLFMDDKKYKNHQRESAWNALKKIASENKELDEYLTLFLGVDYKSSRFIPTKDKWNYQAKLVFAPKEGAKIVANGQLDINSPLIKQGISSELQNSFSLIASKFNASNLNKQDIKNTFGSMEFEGLFKKAYQYQGSVLREYVTSSSLINQEGLYGVDYFLKQWGGSEFASKFSAIGDNYYEKLYLLKNYAGLLGGLDDEGIKKLLDNGIKYGKQNGVAVGTQLDSDQIKNLGESMIWYVNVGDKDHILLAPVVYLSPKSSSTPDFFAQMNANTINLKSNELESLFGKISSRGEIKAVIEGNLSFYSSVLQAQNASLIAKNLIFSAQESILEDSSKSTIFGSNMEVKNTLSLQAQNNLTLENTSISGEKNSSITLSGKNVSLLNGYSQASTYSYDEQNGKVLNLITQKQDVLASSIFGGEIKIVAQDFQIKGSNIEAQNSLSIFADNINISSANSTQREQIYAVGSGVSNGMQTLAMSKGDILMQGSVASKLNSKGNLLLKASNLGITGSNVEASGTLNMIANEIAINQGNNILDAKENHLSIVALNYNNTTTHTLSNLAVKSKISGGEINLSANEVSLQGVDVNANTLKIEANTLTLKAAESNTSKETHGINLGLFGGANAQILGIGKGISYNEGNTTVTTIGNFSDGITLGGIRTEVFGDAEIGVKLTILSEKQQTTNYTQNALSANNIIFKAKEFDLGSSNISAKQDLQIEADTFKNTQYFDTSSTQSSKFSIYLREKIEGTSQVVALINQQGEQIINAANGKDPNVGIMIASGVTGSINIMSNSLASFSSAQSIGLQTQLKNQSSSKQLIGNLSAGGDVALSAKEGDLDLRGIGIQANNIKLSAKGSVYGEAGYESENSKETSITLSAEVNQNVGLSIRDGASVTFGSAGVASISHNKAQQTTSHLTTWEAKGKFEIFSGGDINLKGNTLKANEVALFGSGNLNISSTLDTKQVEKNGVFLLGSAALGLSSEHLFTGDGAVTVGINHNQYASTQIAQQAGIYTNHFEAKIAGDMYLGSAIISDQSGAGNIELGGQTFSKEFVTYEKQDGANVRVNGNTKYGFGGAIDIDDHINNEFQVQNALSGVTINSSSNHGINTDTQNTLKQIHKDTWSGGSINLSTSPTKLQGIKDRVLKTKQTQEENEGGDIVYTTRL